MIVHPQAGDAGKLGGVIRRCESQTSDGLDSRLVLKA